MEAMWTMWPGLLVYSYKGAWRCGSVVAAEKRRQRRKASSLRKTNFAALRESSSRMARIGRLLPRPNNLIR
jgi:hypothetical protein